MALSFQPKGPVYIEDGTEIHFKRASQADLNKFNLDHNPFKNRSTEDRKEVYKKISDGKLDEIELTPDEKYITDSQMSTFCLEFVADVKNLVDQEGTVIDFNSLPKDHKLIFFEDLYFNDDDFRDFVIAVKNGAKKKFTEMAQD